MRNPLVEIDGRKFVVMENSQYAACSDIEDAYRNVLDCKYDGQTPLYIRGMDDEEGEWLVVSNQPITAEDDHRVHVQYEASVPT